MPRSIKKLSLCTLIVLLTACSLWASQTITTPSLPVAGQNALLYGNQSRDDLKALYLFAMDQAKEAIWISIYSFRDRARLAKLREKAESGVQVTVICDPEASSGVRKKLGGRVQTLYRKEKGIMHQKILIVDNQNIWIGSANFTTESLRLHGNLVVGMVNPEIAKWIKEHQEMGSAAKTFTVGSQTVEFWLTKENPKAAERIIQLMQSAKKSIRVAMFTWTRDDFTISLSQAAQKGIQTAVILDYHASVGSSRKTTEMMREKGIPFQVSSGNGLLHHKMMWIDEETLVSGSANWTKAAFTSNNDCFLVLHDLTAEQKRKLDKIWHTLQMDSRPQILN